MDERQKKVENIFFTEFAYLLERITGIPAHHICDLFAHAYYNAPISAEARTIVSTQGGIDLCKAFQNHDYESEAVMKLRQFLQDERMRMDENLRRMDLLIDALSPERFKNPKGAPGRMNNAKTKGGRAREISDTVVGMIRDLHAQGKTQGEIAKAKGVKKMNGGKISPGTISKIINGQGRFSENSK